ncbi:hypothetical protein EKG35_10220 [Lysinibacillus telephonicus]|uniref:ATPase dynein-related AAA domain-containing protein n=2 Tax=Lysinibacillus telephonicus TaxID=1714840 RepID=A0A3S0J332_9BACI|nr:hypothetical protein EKG35_10220 [Lysinibacillus telephonicus]
MVLIKINRSFKENMTPEQLYRATSYSWVASFKKTETRDIKYYCAVYQNKIIEVYDFLGYEEEIPRREPSRYILHGQLSSEDIRRTLIGLDVSDLHKGSGNPIKYTSLERLLNLESLGAQKNEKVRKDIEQNELISHIRNYITSKGFTYLKKDIKNLYLSLRSKPFVIISGISGTGKTKIVQLFAEAIGATEENKQFKLIPVRPDWSDSSELLGYTDIKGDFIKGPLIEIVEQAHLNPELPHFVLLDEMNLARVEYYFSDVLSVMESRKKVEGEITSSTLITVDGDSLTLPGNLYIIGTVNMDETTHPFSKKVLDRANTIEFHEIDLMNFGSMTRREIVEPIHVSNKVLESSFIHLIDAFSTHEQLIREVSERLEAINELLEPIHAQVGYRVRDEISFYLAHNVEAGQLLSLNDAMDFCIMQKILPRVGGMEAVVRDVLNNLKEELSSYPRCTKKIKEMLGRLDKDGFTSFWIS